MAELEQAAPPPVASGGQGTAPAYTGQADSAPAGSVAPSQPSGQPTEPRAASAQPATPSEQSKEPVWDSELGWKSPADAKRDYKAAQAAFTRASQLLRELGDPNEIKQLREFTDQLRTDPEFIKWAEARMAQQQTGSDDPQAVEALRIVDQRVETKARELMAPLLAQAIQQRTKAIFAEMSRVHGSEWEAQKPKMLELHQRDMSRGLVHPQAEQNFDFDYVEGLYHRVLGADPNYAAGQYQKRLASKQQQATISQPGTAPAAVTIGPAKSWDEAYSNAKKQLGLA